MLIHFVWNVGTFEDFAEFLILIAGIEIAIIILVVSAMAR